MKLFVGFILGCPAIVRLLTPSEDYHSTVNQTKTNASISASSLTKLKVDAAQIPQTSADLSLLQKDYYGGQTADRTFLLF